MPEFQIIGRVGKVSEVGSATKVIIAANYPRKDKTGEWKDDPHWNSVTIFDEQTEATSPNTSAKAVCDGYEKDGGTIFTVDLICTDSSRLAKPSEDAGE